MSSRTKSTGRQRQQTLRATIAWSYDLLRPVSSSGCSGSLGVFAGGSGLAAVTAAVPADDLVAATPRPALRPRRRQPGASRGRRRRGTPVQPPGDRARLRPDQLDSRGVLTTRQSAHAQFFYDLTMTLRRGMTTAAHGRHRAVLVRELPNLRAMLAAGPPDVRHPEFYAGSVPPSHVVTMVVSTLGLYSRRADALAIAETALRETGIDPYGAAALHRQLAVLRADGWLPGAPEHAQLTLDLTSTLPRIPLPDWVDPDVLEFTAVRQQMFEHQARGRLRDAREACDRLLALAEDGRALHRALAHEAVYHQAYTEKDFVRARHYLCLERDVLVELGDEREQVLWVNNMADLELRMGERDLAAVRLAATTEDVIGLGDLDVLMAYAETFAVAVGPHYPDCV